MIERARSVLAELEKSGGNNAASMLDDLPLFSLARHQAAAPPVEMAPDPAEAELLAAIDALAPDELSPREALEAVYRLKALRAGIGRAHG